MRITGYHVMRPNRAYIASLGTTTVMIASAVLLLAVVSTLVAFNGWPGAGIARDVGSLVVKEPDASVRVTGPAALVADALPGAADVASEPLPAGAAAAAAAPAPAGTNAGALPVAGLGEGGGEVTPTPPSITNGPVVPEAPADRPSAAGLPALLPDNSAGRGVSGLTNTLGDTTQGVGGTLGDTVGVLSPELGNTVTQAGDVLADLLRQLGQTR
jgi:hypothetical protein